MDSLRDKKFANIRLMKVMIAHLLEGIIILAFPSITLLNFLYSFENLPQWAVITLISVSVSLGFLTREILELKEKIFRK